MDFRKLLYRFHQFGGGRLVVEYVRIGTFGAAIKAGIMCLLKRQSFKAIYPEILKKVEPMLIKRYEPLMRLKKKEIAGLSLDHKHNKIVWFCWLQGIEQAPAIVKACYNSLQRHLVQEFKVQGIQGYEIKVIDNENWKEYVELPDYIVKKWEKKRIPAALFSDLLRLELLIKYGGTWIDSTVLCTGFQDSCFKFQDYLDADLFLFQYTKQGCIPVSISNWFITACSNNEVLIVLRDMLYAYWKDYSCTLDYYIFHLFFAMVAKEYPEQIAAMPYGYSMNSLVLLHHWGEKFNQKKWKNLTSKVCFHKLAFRIGDEVKSNKENYYNHILDAYGGI